MAVLSGKSYWMGSMCVWNKLRLGLLGITRNTKMNKARKTNGFMPRPKTTHERKDYGCGERIILIRLGNIGGCMDRNRTVGKLYTLLV